MANSTADGSVVIDVNMDVSQAEKRLGKLRSDIKKTEKEIADMTAAKEEAKQKSLFQAAELDAEKDKLQEIKDRLEEIRNLSKDKSISVDKREAYAAQISAVKQEYDEQKTRVRALESEWNKTENAVDSYNKKIAASNQKLDDLKTEAGILTQEIDEAVRKQNGFAKASAAADKAMGRLGKRILGLAASALVFNVISRALTSLQQLTMKYIKTNDEARQAIAQMKGALLTLAQPLIEIIIPAFVTLVNILTKIIAMAAQLVSALFGKTVKQSKDGAKALYNEANAIGAVGEAAEEAAGSLAGFDEINTINTEDAKAAGAGGGAAGSEIAPEFGDFGIDSGLLDRLSEIADLVGLIGAGFALWKIGSMLPGVLGQIAQFLGGILLTVGGLMLFWDGLTDAWENGVDWLNLIEMIGGLAAAAFGLYTVFEMLHPGWGKIAAGVALVVGGIAMLVTGFHDAMENGWNLENTLLSIAGILATGLGIALLTGSWIPLLIAAIASVLLALTIATGHGEELLDGVREVIEGFKDFFVGIFTGDIEKAIGGVGKIFEGLKKTVFAVLDGIKDSFLSFLNWLDEKTGGKFHGIIEIAKGFVTTFFDDLKTTLGGWIDGVKTVFEGLIKFLTGVFTNDWDMAWEGVKEIFKGMWNSNISLLEGAVNLIIKGLNWLISQMNKIQFDVPEWVPGVGGNSIGVNIPSISELNIPRLAQGAVIPPNREFMAVLGDQKRGYNIEAPADLIRQMVIEGINAAGVSAGNDRPIQVNVLLDGKVVARNTVHHINDMTRQAGKPVLLL
jgi:hypothetical protein